MITVSSMRGLGDCIYQRAFVKNLPKPVYLDTPWPELYSDIPDVHFIKPDTQLRTQSKNIARHNEWVAPPARQRPVNVAYGSEGIIQGMSARFGIAPGSFDLPPLPPSPESGKYVVLRPVTVRQEWRADTRNPEPEYVAHAALQAKARGYRVISVADLQDGAEWLVGDLPHADVRYHAGELPVERLLALVGDAAAVIGGSGWIVPAALAAQVPAFIICGGQGGFNSPDLICPPDSSITFAVPDDFCRCKLKQHNCNKRINDYAAIFARWADKHLAVV